jgi:capsular polysaccharide transport system permease protein
MPSQRRDDRAGFGGRLATRVDVITALIVRDMMVRFGRHHLGFVWTVLEPMILTAGVMLIWSLIKEPIIHGIPVIVFVLTGYMPLTLWRHLTNPMVKIFRANAAPYLLKGAT